MIRNKFNVLVGGQWGSEGKGMFSSALAWKYKPDVLSTTNMANAGHTAVSVEGDKFVAKALPAASAVGLWNDEGYEPVVLVGAASAFHVDRLIAEAKTINTGSNKVTVVVHDRAGVITEEHRNTESGNSGSTGSTKHVASTMQGCGAFLSEKILRKPGLLLAADYKEVLSKEVGVVVVSGSEMVSMVQGKTVLHEGAQGFSLDINHGSHYPNCTSRGTTASQMAADMGVGPKDVGRVYVVIRPYPIRVGNVVEDGVQKGYSGGCYDDQEEISWDRVAREAGMPDEQALLLLRNELTTVTKRLRRVFTFSARQIKEACKINGATDLLLNFAGYIDWSCSGVTEWEGLSIRVLNFVRMCEDLTGVPVSAVGTGPRWSDVCWNPECSTKSLSAKFPLFVEDDYTE